MNRSRQGARLLVLLTLAAAWGAAPAPALQELPAGQNHRGIVSEGPYQIFPENRIANAVYYDNKLEFSLPDESILHIVPLPEEGRFAYLARDGEGNTRLGVHVRPQDGEVRIRRIAEGYHHAVMRLDGVVYKKLYRVLDGERLMDLLPRSKTGDGAVAGDKGVVFYHVATAEERETDAGGTENLFGMQLHLSLYDEERVRDLGFLVQNRLPRLSLEWADADHVSYTLADGRTEDVSLSQFQ